MIAPSARMMLLCLVAVKKIRFWSAAWAVLKTRGADGSRKNESARAAAARLFVLFRDEVEVIGLVLDGVVGRDLQEGWVGFGAGKVSEFVSGFADTGVVSFCH